METTLLARTLTEHGLVPHRLTGDQLWLDPQHPAVALLSAPLTVPFLATATLGAGSLATAYQDFAAKSDRVGRWAAAASERIPPGACRVRVRLPAGTSTGLRLFVLQALRQGLGGKDGTQGLWFDIAHDLPAAPSHHDLVITVPTAAARPLTRVMLCCYAAAALVACIGLRRGIRFAEHPSVDAYKSRLGNGGAHPTPIRQDQIIPYAAAWLRNREFTRGHLVCYDPDLMPSLAGRAPELAALSGHDWEIHPGSRWNHHSFQAVYGDPGTGVVAVTPHPGDDTLLRSQAALATASHAALADRALLLSAANPEAAPDTTEIRPRR
jgi:hypothetical protein